MSNPRPALNSIPKEAIVDALNAKSMKLSVLGCLEWGGYIASNGYGRVRIGGHQYPAHRAAYVAMFGAIDDELDACHACDNRRCINPHHIVPGTRSENMIDASRKKRLHAHVSPSTMPRHERHGHSKLTSKDVEMIRATKGQTIALAAMLGVDKSTVRRIRNGSLWSSPPSAQGGGDGE